jgi:hypothetical protein
MSEPNKIAYIAEDSHIGYRFPNAKSVEEVQCHCGCLFCPKRGRKYTLRNPEEERIYRCRQEWEAWKSDALKRWRYSQMIPERNAQMDELTLEEIDRYQTDCISPTTNNVGNDLYTRFDARMNCDGIGNLFVCE